MLYHLHFDEDNCPYGDDAMCEDVFIEANECINIQTLFDEVDSIKCQMDDPWCGIEDNDDFDEDQSNPYYDEYHDYGWNEKIEEAIILVAKQHPEWELKTVDIKTYTTCIN